jgi:glutamyl-tRNA synthetase
MNPNGNVRVRFAPSPTGFFHIGGARTALFNWLYAHHTGGAFVLRIEDTDEQRNTPEALEVILSSLRWLGLDWDEGPGVGGSHGPYFQSERSDLYRRYIEQLETSGRAYERDGAIYFKVSGEPQEIDDAVRGKVVRREEKDFVIVRSNGKPVFHLVVVVDDIAMGITHVIRGEDHLSNTSKHTELFKAFDAPLPKFAHIPLILKANGPGKMSKRDSGFLVEDYQKRDFLPEAVRNYLCLLGWSPKDDSEVLSLDELIGRFDLPGIIKDSARFDERKLVFFNTEYLRGLPIGSFVELARPVLLNAGTIDDRTEEGYLKSVLTLCQEKVRLLGELPVYVDYFFNEAFPVDAKAKTKIFRRGAPCERLRELAAALESVESFSEEKLEITVKCLAESNEVYTGDFIHPARLAISGTNAGPSFYGLLRVLGKRRSLSRIQSFIDRFEESES